VPIEEEEVIIYGLQVLDLSENAVWLVSILSLKVYVR
jgi:hypothetical protein